MMVQAEIPEELAKEARMHTKSIDEAEDYVGERIDGVRLQWPDLDEGGC
jgi:hypothetical protein